MIQIQWKLKPYLEQTKVTPHKLALEAGISPPNLYTLIRGEGAKNVSRETLAKIIGALRRLTGQPVMPNDLLEVVEAPEPLEIDEETRTWMDAGLEDMAARLADIEKDVPPEKLAAWFEAMQKAAKPVAYDSKRRVWLEGQAALEYQQRATR
jgi:DNA-binding Xre family transcriptional regulator